MSRPSAEDIRARKGARFPVITAYDAAFARVVDAAGIDVLLVGDSLGNVVLGFQSTQSVTMADMQRAAGAAARGSAHAHVIVDMPYGSYEDSDAAAVANARALVEAGATSVKLEGGAEMAPRIAAIVHAGIAVCAHLGVLPQTAAQTGGFKLKRDRERLFADLHAVVAAGAFTAVLEMVEDVLAGEMTQAAPITTIGIGSGPHTDGQVLVLHDALGLYPSSPPFAKRYADLGSIATDALRAYAADVRDGSFPPMRAPKAPVAAVNPYDGGNASVG